MPTSVESKGEGHIPAEYTLDQNHPNPFGLISRILFGVNAVGQINIAVSNALGQRVKVLADEQIAAGNNVATCDGRNDRGLSMSRRVHFYRLESKSFTATRSVVFVKEDSTGNSFRSAFPGASER